LRTALVVFSGEYDVSCRKRWRDELERLSCEPNVIIDFSDVTYLDATCMTELLRLHERRHAKGFGRETVVLHRPVVRRLFESCRCKTSFESWKPSTRPSIRRSWPHRASCVRGGIDAFRPPIDRPSNAINTCPQ